MAAAVATGGANNCSDPTGFHNYSNSKCHGLLNAPAGNDSPADCFGVCCSDVSCRTWQWAKGSKGGCWTGTCENKLAKDKGWVGGDRTKAPAAPSPSSPIPPPPSPSPSPGPGHQTAITIDPTDLGPISEGVGGASGGGGGTRLLVDYPLKQREELLDVLFKPKYGASLQQLKVEIGCDGDTTQGSEQTHARVNASDLDFDRGYEVWFMMQAAARRPEILLSGLEWGVPGWIAKAPGGLWGSANVDYLVGWVTGLKKQKNLTISALGVAYNERGYDTTFIKTMRQALDKAGLSGVRTIAADSDGSKAWGVAKDMEKDKELAAAIDIIGVHCPGPVNGQGPVPSDVLKLNKTLWSTEQHIDAFGPGPHNTQIHSLYEWVSALGLARVLNQGYVTGHQTATLVWTPIYR